MSKRAAFILTPQLLCMETKLVIKNKTHLTTVYAGLKIKSLSDSLCIADLFNPLKHCGYCVNYENL
jgi:hypothetical protein